MDDSGTRTDARAPERRHGPARALFRRKRPPRWLLVAAVVALLIIAFVAVFDWNWLRGPIERRVHAATGRHLAIGDLDVQWRRNLQIRIGELRFANAGWAREPHMLTFERAELDVAYWPLLRGELVFPRMALQGARIWLERNTQGEANWVLAAKERPRRSQRIWLPRIDQLSVLQGEIRLVEPSLQTRLQLGLNSGSSDRIGRPAPLLIQGTGRYRACDFEVQGRIDSPVQLLDRDQPYRIDLRARAGDTRARATGSLRSTVQLQDFDVDFQLSGENLAHLYPLLGLALPETPPYHIAGRLSHANERWHYRDFTGRLGDSDVVGDVSIDVRGEKPFLQGTLASRRLDFDDLAGMVGGTPQTQEGERASSEQRERAAARAARATILPDRRFDLQKLRSMDADVKFHAEAIHAPKLPLESLTAHVRLLDGVLQVDPLAIGTAGGTLRGSVVMDASVNPIATTTALQLRNLQLPRVFRKLKSGTTGLIAGEVQLAGTGNSVAQMLASADGNVDLVMGPARVNILLIELAGLDVAEALRYAVGKDKMIDVRCAYAQLDVDEGLMTSQALVFDTSDTAIVGAGTINLRKEQLDLELRPRPKDPSPLALRVPLQIEGTFKDPSLTPSKGPLAARAAAAVALYALAPPAALLALIETGPGENVACGEALAEAEITTATGKDARRERSRG